MINKQAFYYPAVLDKEKFLYQLVRKVYDGISTHMWLYRPFGRNWKMPRIYRLLAWEFLVR